MKTIVIALLAGVASPALADVYRCTAGSKTIYQDVPCRNAKVIDNINGQGPSRHEQLSAMERAKIEQALATQLREHREAEDHKSTTTTAPKMTGPSPAAPMPSRPDKYYDRPDRYYDRPDPYNSRSVR